MSVILVRIDDRLVHGQVVEGWLRVIHATHIVVANDAVASDETQKILYSLAVPYGVSLSCLSLQEASKVWQKNAWGDDKVLILVSTPEDVVKLVAYGSPIQSVNLGGLHFRPGRIQILRAVSLDDRDVIALRELESKGIVLEARPLPLDEPVDVRPYLTTWQGSQDVREQPR